MNKSNANGHKQNSTDLAQILSPIRYLPIIIIKSFLFNNYDTKLWGEYRWDTYRLDICQRTQKLSLRALPRPRDIERFA